MESRKVLNEEGCDCYLKREQRLVTFRIGNSCNANKKWEEKQGPCSSSRKKMSSVMDKNGSMWKRRREEGSEIDAHVLFITYTFLAYPCDPRATPYHCFVRKMTDLSVNSSHFSMKLLEIFDGDNDGKQTLW